MTTFANLIPDFNSPNVTNQDFDDMDNWDDVLTGVFSFFDNNESNSDGRMNNVMIPQGTPGMTMGPQNFTVVTPCSSANELNESSLLEPTAISEMLTPYANTFVPPSSNFSPVAPLAPTFTPLAPAAAQMVYKPASVPKSAPKKRRHSAVEEDSFYFGGDNEVHEQRRERNREHARKSRLRKKSLTEGLQQSMVELKEENSKLRERVHALIGEKQTEAIVQARLIAPTENFITALKNNCVVDNEAKQFLQSLRKKLPSGIIEKVHVVG